MSKPPAADRKRIEQAIAQGDIAWHALPFSWQTEMMDQSMIAASVGLSHSLDRRFGRTTTGAKMTDVPGHTLGLISPLAAEGVKFLDIGGNGVCAHPEVPPIFVWKDPAGASIMVINEPDYGGVTLVPGSDLAISVNVRGDNSGPHPPDEVAQIYADLHRRFPNAEIVATSLTEIANAIEPHRANLPVITQEIGDTWITGVASDPLKIARYLEVSRLRQSWIAQGKLKSGDATDIALLRGTLLEIEHTWGADIKSWLDYDHYTPAELAQVLNTPHYKVVQFSWDEKRKDQLDAVATLPAPLRAEADQRMRSLAPVEPKIAAWPRHDTAETIETKHFQVALDPKTGAICRLHAKKTGSDWATQEKPQALFSYQTLAKIDFDRFIDAYLTFHPTWANGDLGKPNIEQRGAESRVWSPTLIDCRHSSDATGHKIVAQIKIDDPEKEKSGVVAWPQRMFLEYTLPDAEPVVEIAFSWFGKPPTRMPEALWLTFQPPVSDQHGWTLEKSGYSISPFDVVDGGNRAMHAVLGGLHYKGPEGALHVETMDAPLVALGVKHPWYFTRNQPNLADGFHFCLFNNAWGTNYVMWFGEDMRYRFRIVT